MYKLYRDPKPTCLFNLEQFWASPAALPSSPASQSFLQAVRQAPGSDLSAWDSRLSAWRSVASLPHWSGTSTSHHVSTTVLPREVGPHTAWDGPGHFCPLLWCIFCALSLPLGSFQGRDISGRCYSLSLLLSGSVICIFHKYPPTEELCCIHFPLHHSLSIPGDTTWHWREDGAGLVRRRYLATWKQPAALDFYVFVWSQLWVCVCVCVHACVCMHS